MSFNVFPKVSFGRDSARPVPVQRLGEGKPGPDGEVPRWGAVGGVGAVSPGGGRGAAGGARRRRCGEGTTLLSRSAPAAVSGPGAPHSGQGTRVKSGLVEREREREREREGEREGEREREKRERETEREIEREERETERGRERERCFI